MDSAISIEKRYCNIKKKRSKRKIRKGKLYLKSTKTNIKANDIKPLRPAENITKSRLLLKHGLFAKGTKSQPVTRLGLSEEFKARSEGDLHRLIDLANPLNIQPEFQLQNLQSDFEIQQTAINPKELATDEFVQSSNILAEKCVANNFLNLSSESEQDVPTTVIPFDSTSNNHPSCSSINPNYLMLYKQFTESASKELTKYHTSKSTNNLLQNITKKLKTLYRNNKLSFNKLNVKPTVIFEAPFVDRVQPFTEDSVILNPMQFLERANPFTKVCLNKQETNKKKHTSVRYDNLIKKSTENLSLTRVSSGLQTNTFDSPENEAFSDCILHHQTTPEHFYLPRRLTFNK